MWHMLGFIQPMVRMGIWDLCRISMDDLWTHGLKSYYINFWNAMIYISYIYIHRYLDVFRYNIWNKYDNLSRYMIINQWLEWGGLFSDKPIPTISGEHQGWWSYIPGSCSMCIDVVISRRLRSWKHECSMQNLLVREYVTRDPGSTFQIENRCFKALISQFDHPRPTGNNPVIFAGSCRIILLCSMGY